MIINIKKLVCDRCDRETEAPEVWGHVFARARGESGGITAADPTQPADICPECLKELYAWWDKNRRKERKDGSGQRRNHTPR